MDRRIFLALLALASASGSVALAEQVRYAEATGNVRHISREKLLRAVYKLVLTEGGAKVSTGALVNLGYNRAEAVLISEIAKNVARKAGSYENFCGVVEGRAPIGVKLSAQETALIRSQSLNASESKSWSCDACGRKWDGSSGGAN